MRHCFSGPILRHVETERPSARVVEQRLRNRLMDALEPMSQGDDGVRAVGVVEYVEMFFDVIRDDPPLDWRTWSCFTPEEVAAVDVVLRVVSTACDATPGIDDADRFIASGWPEQIRGPASAALDLMTARGRFDEEREETEPSHPG